MSEQAQEVNHWKDPSLNYLELGSTTTTTTTSTTATTASKYQPIPRRPYPVKPSTVKAATTYSLFSDPKAFELSSIYSRTHYITNKLEGKIWYDVNGDAKRGDYRNSTLNEMEYDYGLGNVDNIVLVSCHDDSSENGSEGSGEIRMGTTTSRPYNNQNAIPLRQSLDSTAGTYQFNLQTVPSGRYYVMYQSPRDWSTSGNILPLGRRKATKDGEVYYECVPDGGEGETFRELAVGSGDFDYGGYCARCIGCIEIGTRAELESKFKSLEPLEKTEYYQSVIQGDTAESNPYANVMGGKMVAMPEPHSLDVGMERRDWPLKAKQYADAVVTLRFPVGGDEDEALLEALLGQVFSDAKSFGASANREAMSKTLYKHLAEQFVAMGSGGIPLMSQAQEFSYSSNESGTKKGFDGGDGDDMSESEKFAQDGTSTEEAAQFFDSQDLSESEKFAQDGTSTKEAAQFFDSQDLSESEKFAKQKSQAAVFALEGIDLFDAKIVRKKKNKNGKNATDSTVRYLRALSGAEDDGEEVIEISYTFTAQGTYNPPPHDQIGYFIENSINANPTELVRELRQDKNLPFQDLESADSSHLTVGPPAPKICLGCLAEEMTVINNGGDIGGGLKRWAVAPVILLCTLILSLAFVFFGRRLWKRRVLDVDTTKECELRMMTRDFAISDHDITKEKDGYIGQDSDDDENESKISKKKKSKKKTKLKDHSYTSSSGRTSSLRSIDYSSYSEDEGSLRKQRSERKKKKKKNKLDKSENSRGSNQSQEDDGGSYEEKASFERSIKKKKKSKKKLDNSSRSGTSSSSRGTSKSRDEMDYGEETDEARRRRRRKEKKSQRKLGRDEERLGSDAPPSLDELRFRQMNSRRIDLDID